MRLFVLFAAVLAAAMANPVLEPIKINGANSAADQNQNAGAKWAADQSENADADSAAAQSENAGTDPEADQILRELAEYAATLDNSAAAQSDSERLNEMATQYETTLGQLIPRRSSADRIADYGYPVEEHEVETEDGYYLTMYRIPYSPRLNNSKTRNKPVIFLQHGLLSSSDCWLLNGPDNALAYVMSDAGYDVWLGNFRGNTYSNKHKTHTFFMNSFWDFSWHEIAIYDLPAMIDSVLQKTGEESLHYVGHSQGTTTFMVLLSSLPRYNGKFKTTHMLAPVGYMKNMQSPLAKIAGPILGNTNLLAALFGNHQFLPNSILLGFLGSKTCSDKSPVQDVCGNVLFLMAGWDSKHLNYTLLPEAVQTHPAGSSTSQVVHYLQEYRSGHFRQFDLGRIRNLVTYKQLSPPDYEVEKIGPTTPVQFYYSDNDYFAAVEDVRHMAQRLGKHVELYHVKYPDWNHMDYLWALEVKSEIYDRIISLADAYENNSNHILK